MKFVSLFSGIGGLDLGLERAGWECVAQVERIPCNLRILAKNWPDVPKWRDIHDVRTEDLPDCDAVVGGFPCQPVSLAGRRTAQDDPRWLWPEFFRIVRDIRPRYVLVENVPGLASAGMGDVLGDLASIGYDAEWQSIPAAAVGAPHRRYRIFVVAYPHSTSQRPRCFEPKEERELGDSSGTLREWPCPSCGESWCAWHRQHLQDCDHFEDEAEDPLDFGWWATEPRVGRVAYGVPRRVDRLSGLGEAVVPQVAEWIGRRIMLEHS